MVYVDDVSDAGSSHAEIVGWLNRNRKTAPKGTEGFNVTRGVTARKFVEVAVNVYENIADYKRRFGEWLKTLVASGFPSDWTNLNRYTFRSVGKKTRLT